ncbi:MAG: hypothetical protein GXO81_03035 [Chlorobi bacterium]|nr:hypothetical protein [Chlorobiota bacterium]
MNNLFEDILGSTQNNLLEDNGKELGIKAQLLTGLGYLRHELLVDILKEKQISEAFSTFYTEFTESGLIKKQEFKNIEMLYGEQAEVKLLEIATDIDEGVLFGKLPEFGQKGLQTRIIHYRLNLLGLYAGPIEQAFNANSYFALEKAAFYVQKTKLATLNLLADLQSYTVAFLESYGYQNSLVVFSLKKAKNTDGYPEFKGHFKRRLKKDMKGHEDIFEEIDQHVFYRRDIKVDENFLRTREKEEINSFILRLIQVHQWMGGFYEGLLDADYGEVTLGSLKAIIERYNDTVAEKVKFGEVLARIKGCTFIFNALFFLQQYKIENQASDRSFDTLMILSESYEKASDADRKKFEENMKVGFENIVANQDNLPGKKNGMAYQFFFGIKTFFKKAFKFACKLFRWIVGQVKNVASFIKNTLKMIYRFFKEAVRHFIEGIKFLLGKLPVISSDKNDKIIYSIFDIDKDGINIIGCRDASLVESHMKSVNQKICSMSFSLSLISFLFQALKSLLSAGTVIAWPVFVIKLVTAFKKLVNSYNLIITT